MVSRARHFEGMIHLTYFWALTCLGWGEYTPISSYWFWGELQTRSTDTDICILGTSREVRQILLCTWRWDCEKGHARPRRVLWIWDSLQSPSTFVCRRDEEPERQRMETKKGREGKEVRELWFSHVIFQVSSRAAVSNMGDVGWEE